jgi:hypothetical protein
VKTQKWAACKLKAAQLRLQKKIDQHEQIKKKFSSILNLVGTWVEP